MKRIMLMKILVFFIVMVSFGTPSQAAVAKLTQDKAYTDHVVGQIYKIAPQINRLYIKEEFNQEKWSFFVHSNILKDFKEGDRVRVYYQSLRLPVIRIQKLPALESRTEGKNLGIIYSNK